MDKIFSQTTFKGMAAAVADLVLPRVCVVCGRRLESFERHICLECLADLPYSHFWRYARNPMADKYNERIRDDVRHGEGEDYAFAAALLFYNSESPYRRIPQALKYESAKEQGRRFAARLGRLLASSEQFADVDVVIPVPLHWRRRLSRGYNQAELIAVEIASELGAQINAAVLRRRKFTRTQTRILVGEKASNVSDAFVAKGPLSARHILLVDDTFTTGSTLAACHNALREIVPSTVRISVATLSYVRVS